MSSNKIAKIETIKLVVRPVGSSTYKSVPKATNHVYETEATNVSGNIYTAVLKDIFNKVMANKVNVAVITAVVLGAASIKTVTASDTKEIKTLCEVPIGNIVKASGRVTFISGGLSGNDTTLTIEEVGSNCSSNVSLNQAKSTLSARVGDFVEVSGEASSFGINAKSINVNPSTQAETRSQAMTLTIHKSDLVPAENNTYVLRLGAFGGGNMIIPARLAGEITQGLHQYNVTFVNKHSVLEATGIVKDELIK